MEKNTSSTNHHHSYSMQRAALILKSGRIFYGTWFGAHPVALHLLIGAGQGHYPGITKNAHLSMSKSAGELVFNTAMSGYVEVLSDPSFFGQLICMTYPHIGNYGVDLDWIESRINPFLPDDMRAVRDISTLSLKNANKTDTKKIQRSIMASGLVIKELYDGPLPSTVIPLNQWMCEQGVSGVYGVDTREITRILRDDGTENACIIALPNNNTEKEHCTLYNDDLVSITSSMNDIPNMEGQNLASLVQIDTTSALSVTSQEYVSQKQTKDTSITAQLENIDINVRQSYRASETPDTETDRLGSLTDSLTSSSQKTLLRVGILDFGCKTNIIRSLFDSHQKVEFVSLIPIAPIVPLGHHTTLEYEYESNNIDQTKYTANITQYVEYVISQNDMLLVSNGPGDPQVLKQGIEFIAECLGKIPISGICLGTQLLALAMGARTYKMHFGHHGINHPVKDLTTNQLYITSQNHGFAVDEQSLPSGAKIWFRNTNDQSVEGFMCPTQQVYSVQFHPEAAPGPNDTLWIIDYFLEQAKNNIK